MGLLWEVLPGEMNVRCQFASLIYGDGRQVGGERATREMWSGDKVSRSHAVRDGASQPAWHSLKCEEQSVVCTRRVQWT